VIFDLCIHSNIDDNRVRALYTAKQNRFLVVDNNKMYFLNKKSAHRVAPHNNYTFSWKCRTDQCTGRATSQRIEEFSADINVVLTKEHSFNCQVTDTTVEHSTSLNRIHDAAVVPGARSREAYENEVALLQANNPEVAATFPSFYSLSSSLSRQVQRQRPPNPTLENLLNFGIPYNFTITSDNVPRQFLQQRQSTIDPATGNNCCFLAFGTVERIRDLFNSQHVYMDGTFKITPSPYYQVFTINFMKRCAISNVDKLFTGMTILLTHKSQFMYHTVFSWLLDFLLQHWPDQPLLWQTAMMDFETGLRPTLQQLLPNLQLLLGCFFHFCQCIFRHVKSAGLQVAYNNPNSSLRLWLRKVMALAFLPINMVTETFHLLGENMFYAVQGDNLEQLPALDLLLEYIEDTWMEADKIPLWNVNVPNQANNDDAAVHRTNNDLEGYHLRLLFKFDRKPNFWKFIQLLQQEQLTQDHQFNLIDEGGKMRPRGRIYRQNEANIRIAKIDLQNQVITPLEFLNRVSMAIASNNIM